MVDRLLASPHYGERWAQHWLDLARYADSDGFEFDQARPDAWRYRDWVVEALNQDMPYDQFVRRQLAGDEVAPDDVSAFIATGLNRCYPDMVDLNDQKLRRQNALNDITETTGLVFLGLTIGCARCHDHKFDPIRIHDFYRLQAFFTPARFRDDFPIGAPTERAAYEKEYRRWEEAVTAVQEAVIHVEQPVRSALTPDLLPTVNDETAAAFTRTESERTPTDVHLIYESQVKDRRIAPNAWAYLLDPTSARSATVWISRLADSRRLSRPACPRRGGSTRRARGAAHLCAQPWRSTPPEAMVTPAFPLVLCRDGSAAVPPIATAHSTGRRKALADWLVAPDHPLTARVIVNRLWQHHFGRGLVATPSDFGTMGTSQPIPSCSTGWRPSSSLEAGA